MKEKRSPTGDVVGAVPGRADGSTDALLATSGSSTIVAC